VVIGVMVWLVPVLYQQTISIWNDLTNSIPLIIKNTLGGLLSKESTALILEKYIQLMVQLRNSVNTVLGEIGTIRPVAQGGISAFRSLAEALSGGVRVVTVFVVSTAFVIIISIYYLIDMDAFPRIIRRFLPERNRERIWDILVKADQSVGGFLRGQLIACLIVAVLSSILLFAIGMKQYAILIGCFAGLMHLIPYLGPIAGGTPAILFVLLSQHFVSWKERGIYVLIVLGGFALIETFDGLVTQPFIVGKRASLHPLAVMLALAVGAHFGLGGMIMAVPAACIARVLWMELFWKKRLDLYAGEVLPGEPSSLTETPVGEGGAEGADSGPI
jgi:predicted PurR-regulated permease PerM